MAEPITPRQKMLLQLVAQHPDVARDHLLKAGAAETDLVYLERQDLIREREAGSYRVSHLGQLALKRM